MCNCDRKLATEYRKKVSKEVKNLENFPRACLGSAWDKGGIASYIIKFGAERR